MNLLFRVIFAKACTSTHHKLALDALCHLRGRRAESWRNLFLKNHSLYLEGSKAPDKSFKDFRNHVLHVRDNHWGGAPKQARKWYDRTVDALRGRDWLDAVYSAGVLSHYYTDPIQPFHTGQSQAESNIHRAAEWSITKSYDEIRKITEFEQGFPSIEVPSGSDWLDQMVIGGAELANPHYETMIEHYDFAKGKKNPPAGLDQTSRDILAQLIGHAIVGFARILERAIEDSHAIPPRSDLTLPSVLATLKIPVYWVTHKMADAKERRIVKAMYDELQATGKVDKTLPDDDRIVRDLYEKEVGKTHAVDEKEAVEEEVTVEDPSLPDMIVNDKPAAAPSIVEEETHETVADEIAVVIDEPHVDVDEVEEDEAMEAIDVDADVVEGEFEPVAESTEDDEEEVSLRFYLEADDDVVDAPSIGPKTAERLAVAGIKTVSDLLAADPEEVANQVEHYYITADVVHAWQKQAKLVCSIPQLRGHDASILVACGWDDPDEIAETEPEEMFSIVQPFADTSEGQRIIRSGKKPDLDEVSDWIEWASHARTIRAA